MKKLFNHIFVDGLSGMALGLFATLIMGTIIQQVGILIGGTVGGYLAMFAKIAIVLTGAGIGVGVATKYGASILVTVSAASAGMIGAFANEIKAGTIFTDTGVSLSGSGQPLGAFVAAFVAIEIGKLISGKTKIDIFIIPSISILSGAVVGIYMGIPISKFMNWIGSMINWGTQQHPFIMGIVVSVLMGMLLTLPLSSAALSVALNLSGLAAGAATVGCCCNMIGFAIASFKENGFGGILAQGIGTSMLQISNVVKKPTIWLPAIVASAVLGPVSTVLLKMTNNAVGAGMGTAGFVGQITTYQVMSTYMPSAVVMIEIFIMHFILPGMIAYVVNSFLRKIKWIKDGDMRLNV